MGSLDLIIGCMFSGKSTELIRRCERYKAIGKRVLYINSIKDTRNNENCFGHYNNFSLGKITTHDSKYIQCIKVDKIQDLIQQPFIDEWDVFGIDEAQFFHSLQDVYQLVNEYNKTVIIAGLDGDYKQCVFGDIINLIPKCDSVTKLHSLCKICNDGTSAIFSKRIIDQSLDIELIGGSNEYMAVCRKHLN